MEAEQKFTLMEAHQHFAKSTNRQVWELLGRPQLSVDEQAEARLTAQVSLYHWRVAGTAVHQQRAEWLLAHVYAVFEQPVDCLYHARRCLALTEAHPQEMQDFDQAYAYEGLARALALAGETSLAGEYYRRAAQAGEAIADAEDREIFMGDFNSGKWYGAG